jgi:hypothetical protein
MIKMYAGEANEVVARQGGTIALPRHNGVLHGHVEKRRPLLPRVIRLSNGRQLRLRPVQEIGWK